MAPIAPSQTRVLLERHHSGDPSAIGKLIELHCEAIESAVRQELNSDLRRLGDTGDFVGQVVLRLLKSGPRFVISDPHHFRSLIVVLARNELRDGGRRLHAQRRHPARERRLPTRISVIDLDAHNATDRTPTQPDLSAQHNEEIELAGMALEMLPTDERQILDMRQAGETFARIGSACGMTSEGARKKHNRALHRVREIIAALTSREIDSAIQAAVTHD